MTDPDASQTAQLQWERLQSTLNRACKNIPFHRNRLDSVWPGGYSPEKFEGPEQISLLPFMERKDLEKHYPYGLFGVPMRDIVRIHTAPGSLTNPVVSGYTKQDLSVWRRIVSGALKTAGVGSHDILQICFHPGLANWGRDYKDGAEEIEASVIPNSPLSMEKQVMVLKDYKITVFITTPSYAFLLAEHLFRAGINPTALNMKTLILAGENITREQRDNLEERLHVTTWLHYGMSEIPGPAAAYECPFHEGLHVNEEHFLPEIIDPSDGRVLQTDEPGELVLTTLTTRAFPLIRFRTGDRARLMAEPCPCGGSRRIEWFPSRTDDLKMILGVKVHDKQIKRQLEKALGFSPDFRCRIHDKFGERHFLEIGIGIDTGLFSDEIKGLESLMDSLADRLSDNLGVPVRIRLKEKSSL